MAIKLDIDARGGLDPDPFLDRAYGALSDSRRRHLLSVMREADSPVAVATLAARIAARERDRSVSEVSDAAVQDVYLSLYHVHVPKLVDVGALAHDSERNTVAPGEYFDAVISLLAEPN